MGLRKNDFGGLLYVVIEAQSKAACLFNVSLGFVDVGSEKEEALS